MQMKKTRTENDSDPCNQFFFNIRKQSKYVKTHGVKFYGYFQPWARTWEPRMSFADWFP